MPARPSHLPTHPERTALHRLRHKDLPLAQLGLIGESTINKMIAKGWIVRPGLVGVYRITPGGEAALKEKIPSVPQKSRKRAAETGLKAK